MRSAIFLHPGLLSKLDFFIFIPVIRASNFIKCKGKKQEERCNQDFPARHVSEVVQHRSCGVRIKRCVQKFWVGSCSGQLLGPINGILGRSCREECMHPAAGECNDNNNKLCCCCVVVVVIVLMLCVVCGGTLLMFDEYDMMMY